MENYQDFPPYKISHDLPPIWEELVKTFGPIVHKKWNDRVLVVVYGDTIHQSFKHTMPMDLKVHEMTHVRQHLAYPGGPAAWWKRYLEDITFRLDQEIEAYRNQYRYSQDYMSRPDRRDLIKHMAGDLSSALYGNALSYDRAVAIIKNEHEPADWQKR